MASSTTSRDRTEVVATMLLALAAVATAWSSYQAARWNGEQAKTASRVNRVRIEAAREQSLAEAQSEVTWRPSSPARTLSSPTTTRPPQHRPIYDLRTTCSVSCCSRSCSSSLA